MSAGPAVPGGAEGGPRGRAERLKSALRHPLTITALSALAATLLIPAFTHQWQDRQKERDLKTELATSLDELTTRAVVAARIVIERRFPEAQTTDARKEELESASKEQRAAAARAYRQAVEHERDTRAATYIQLFSDWLVTRSVVRSRLAAYFPGQDLASGWETYANNVTYYIRLGSGTSPDAYRQASVARLSGTAWWATHGCSTRRATRRTSRPTRASPTDSSMRRTTSSAAFWTRTSPATAPTRTSC